jgi:hypothetical protein
MNGNRLGAHSLITGYGWALKVLERRSQRTPVAGSSKHGFHTGGGIY